MHIVDSRRATAHNTKFRFDSLKYGLHWRSFFFKFGRMKLNNILHYFWKMYLKEYFSLKHKIYLTFQNILYSIRIISVLVRVYSIIFEANAKWLQQPNRATFLSRNFSMYQSKIISDYMQAMVPIGYNNFRNMFLKMMNIYIYNS